MTGESTYEPLDVIAADDPVTCAIYAKEKGLLDKPRWQCFRLIAKRESRLLCMENQAKLRSLRCSPKYAYLSKMRHTVIRVQTDEPDFAALLDITYNWAQLVYGNVKEVIPEDCPKPLGKHVTLSHYVNANLYHDMLSGCSVTGILHFINKCPIDWYSKKQGMVKTVTFGSEANATRTATKQIINLHCVREAIASGMVKFFHMPGGINPTDILSKHWGHQQIWKQLQPLLFWKGDTWKLSEKKHCKEVYNGVS